MNRQQYLSDPRYAKVLEKMDLLEIMDISTTRQSKNGTIVWKLPIKDQDSGILIEVASFNSGYVRNQGKSTRSNFQLNKRCESEPEFFDSGKKDSMDRPLYTQWTTRTCKLIPIEIDRLEYLISYCLKNYYIKNANRVADGDYVPKWKLENAQNGMVPKWKYDEAIDLGRTNAEAEALSDCGHYDRIRDLENKLDTIQRISKY